MRAFVNRSVLMFLLGASGFIHELVRGGAERPFILALSGALMGLPFMLNADQKWGTTKGSEEEDKWSHLP